MRRPRLPPHSGSRSQLCSPAVRLGLAPGMPGDGPAGQGVRLAVARPMVGGSVSPIPNSGPNSSLRSTELGWGVNHQHHPITTAVPQHQLRFQGHGADQGLCLGLTLQFMYTLNLSHQNLWGSPQPAMEANALKQISFLPSFLPFFPSFLSSIFLPFFLSLHDIYPLSIATGCIFA